MNYALLVGINEYIVSRNLRGCVNDVDLVKSYLEEDISQSSPFDVQVLTDQQATRNAILYHFRSHLGRAQAGEIAFFYFSGHGAQARSPRAWRPYQDGIMHENLVCHDSRYQGVPYLADREIGALVQELARRKVEVVVIFDCCHSGSGTREEIKDEAQEYVGVRQVANDTFERASDSYLPDTFKPFDKDAPYVFLSACAPHELARERYIGHSVNNLHGLFTYSLISSLRSPTLGIQTSYQDLIHAAHYKLKGFLSPGVAQTPQMLVHGRFPIYHAFLHDTMAPEADQRFSMKYDPYDGEWKVNVGSLMGLKVDQAARFEIFKRKDLSKTLGYGTTKSIGLTDSTLEIEAYDVLPLEGLGYHLKAVYLPLEIQTFSMNLRDSAPYIAQFFQSLIGQKSNERMGFQLLEAPNNSLFEVVGKDEALEIRYSGEHEAMHRDPIIISETLIETEAWPKLQFGLRHVSYWQRLLQLQNPQTDVSYLRSEIELYLSDIKLDLKKAVQFVTLDQETHRDPYTFAIESKSDDRMYVRLLTMGSDISFQETNGNFTLSPHKGRKILDKGALVLPPYGKGSYHDVAIFKLILSLQDLPYLRLASPESLSDILDKFGETSPFRKAESSPKDLTAAWFTYTLYIKHLLTLGEVHASESIMPEDSMLEIGTHPTFQAKVSLSRAQRQYLIPKVDHDMRFFVEKAGLDLLDLSMSKQGLTILDLHHIEAADSLAPHPLTIHLYPDLEEDIQLLPITLPPTLEAEDFQFQTPGDFPIWGDPIMPDTTGRYTFKMYHVPTNPPDGRPSQVQSLKISFIKIPTGKEIQTIRDDQGQKWCVLNKK
ncbi:MAG: caspase family protein [Bacteroidota bacterium]